MSSIQSTPSPAAGPGSAAVSGAAGAGQSVSTGTASGTAQTAAVKTAANSTGNAAGNAGNKAGEGFSFSGALLQYMTGFPAAAADADKTPTLPTSDNGVKLAESLLALVNGANMAGTAGTDSQSEAGKAEHLTDTLDALAGLLQNSGDMEELLAANPDLMAQLQVWIQQALQLLQSAAGMPTGTAEAAVSPDNDNPLTGQIGNTKLPELPLLAKQPETLTFALMDTLQSIKEQLSLNGNSAVSAGSFSQLVSALQKTLGEVVSHPVQQAQLAPAAQVELSEDSGSAIPSTSVQHSEGVAQRAKEEQSSSQQQSSSDNTPFAGSNVVTAGQLQLKDGASAAAKAPAPVPVENFAREMTGFVVNKLDIVKLQGMTEAKISLTPEHLGQVDIRITLHNGQVVAQFITEHAFAKDSIEQQMAQLRTALQSQGLQVDKLEVTQNASLSSHMYQEGKQPGSGSQQRQQSRRRAGEEEEGMMTLDTIEEWNEWVKEVQAKQANFGSSFVAKA